MAVTVPEDLDIVLAPWPVGSINDPDLAVRSPVVFATSYLKDLISPGASDATIRRLGETAAAHVERYAPSAPKAVKNEAVVRFAGYLIQSNTGPITKLDVGRVNIERTTNHAGMFRNSGAAGLLSSWKRRRAGLISGTHSESA